MRLRSAKNRIAGGDADGFKYCQLILYNLCYSKIHPLPCKTVAPLYVILDDLLAKCKMSFQFT
jgi:hypothetical protein